MGQRTICFAKSRRAAELVHRFACERLDPATAAQLSPYRAGYTPEQRREIERRLVEGELLGVTATDALELGIDVGLLDCAISVGFPGTVASLRQQWGRAGRRCTGSRCWSPRRTRSTSSSCASPRRSWAGASRRRSSTTRTRGSSTATSARRRSRRRSTSATRRRSAPRRSSAPPLLPDLKKTKAGYVWAGRDFPAAKIGLRDTSGDSFSVVEAETGAILGTVERERAYSTVHEGAMYLHMGQSYRVLALDLEARAALVEPLRGELLHAGQEGDPDGDRGGRGRRTATRARPRLRPRLGDRAGDRLPEAARSRTAPRSTLVPLDLPETTFETEAVWYLPEPGQLDEFEEMPQLLGTLHAAEHAMIALLPLWAMCDRWDIGGLSTNIHFQTGRPTIFVYDGHPGGVGLTRRGFDAFEGWVEDTAKMLAGCPCEHGCPSCVQSPKCGNLNEPLDKAGALSLLERMLSSR